MLRYKRAKWNAFAFGGRNHVIEKEGQVIEKKCKKYLNYLYEMSVRSNQGNIDLFL